MAEEEREKNTVKHVSKEGKTTVIEIMKNSCTFGSRLTCDIRIHGYGLEDEIGILFFKRGYFLPYVEGIVVDGREVERNRKVYGNGGVLSIEIKEETFIAEIKGGMERRGEELPIKFNSTVVGSPWRRGGEEGKGGEKEEEEEGEELLSARGEEEVEEEKEGGEEGKEEEKKEEESERDMEKSVINDCTETTTSISTSTIIDQSLLAVMGEGEEKEEKEEKERAINLSSVNIKVIKKPGEEEVIEGDSFEEITMDTIEATAEESPKKRKRTPSKTAKVERFSLLDELPYEDSGTPTKRVRAASVINTLKKGKRK